MSDYNSFGMKTVDAFRGRRHNQRTDLDKASMDEQFDENAYSVTDKGAQPAPKPHSQLLHGATMTELDIYGVSGDAARNPEVQRMASDKAKEHYANNKLFVLITLMAVAMIALLFAMLGVTFWANKLAQVAGLQLLLCLSCRLSI
jgi:hypothetical protein